VVSCYLSNSFLSFGIDGCFLTQKFGIVELRVLTMFMDVLFGEICFLSLYSFLKLGFGYCSFKLMN